MLLDGSATPIGNATVLLECAGFRVLTDPNFLHRGEYAYLGHGLVSRRLTEPALRLEELPPLDVVVLSHLHGDHFDRRARAGLDRALPVVTTTHGATRLRPQGFAAVVGLRTGETHLLTKGDATLRITALPGSHARGPFQALLPPVMGSLLEFATGGESYRVWVSGDTLLRDDMTAIRELRPDLGLVHLGGTRVLGALVTMDAEQGWRALDRVQPRHAVPVHHSDYTVFRSPLSHFRHLVERHPLPATRVHVVPYGTTWRFRSDAALPG